MIEELVLNDLKETSEIEKKSKNKPGIWDKIFKKKKLEKQEKTAVLFLRNNGRAEAFALSPKNGFYTIYGKAYHEREDCTWQFAKQRIPLVIIPENDIIPIGNVNWVEKKIKEKFLEIQTHAMKGIRHAELVKLSGENNKPFNVKAAVLICIAIIIGLAVWQGGLI